MIIEIAIMSHMRLPFIALFLGLLILAPNVTMAEQYGSFKTADGLHTEPWFNITSGDLREDQQAALAQNKKLVIFWEQRGCVYCEKLHEVNLKVEATVHFIRRSFYAVLLNMRGDRPMIDFDGTPMDEAKLARAHRVSGTPTIEFRDGRAEEVFRMPGYAEPFIFHGVFDYVANDGYRDLELGPWLRANYLEHI